MKVKILDCKQCGHEWILRGIKNPMRCPSPKCQSPNWNTPKKIKTMKVGQDPTAKGLLKWPQFKNSKL
jgi:hypothetical protein